MISSNLTSKNAFAGAVLCAAGLLLSGCNTATQPSKPQLALTEPATKTDRLPEPTLSNGITAGAEAFSAKEYGVAASPLVATGKSLRRGGGYQMVGKPYTVKGVTYVPTERQKKTQSGRASWYGKAFHGRLTANGEVYDMNHLTGAHKTMPLPSYARVTNKKNGKSVIVRVNDRGPFSKSRIIDVSKRAAQVLDFINAGTAEVQVEYIGPAPLHGKDDDYLLASARGLTPTAQTQLASSAPVSSKLPGVKNVADIPVTNAAYVPEEGILPVPSGAVRQIPAAASAYAEFRVWQAFAQTETAYAWKKR